uniref:Uncharacterized protein n=1 Tax=Acrobeloides nanus TaxID=290746 RepID=A0A914EHR2_9BILA
MMSNMGTWILLALMVLVGSSFGAGIGKKRVNVNSVCDSPGNTASLVVVNFTLIPGGSDSSSYPLGYCDCNQGQQYFWNSTQDSLPLDSYRDHTLAQSLDSSQPNGCADICVCDINGVCYKPEDSTNYNIDLVPYCNNSECYVYGAVYNRSLWIGEGGQVAYQEDNDIPVGINSPYLKIASIGCGGCENLKNLNCSQTFIVVEYNDTDSNSDGGLWASSSSSSSFDFSSFDLSSILESKEVKEVLCLIPADVIGFVENVTLLEVYKLFKLYPQFAAVMDPNQQTTPEQLEEIVKNGAPTVYTKLEALLQPYKQRWEQMPLAAQDFLNDLGNATDKMKVIQSNSDENYPIAHEFFQGLYQNYTQLDNSSRTSIENFIPTMTHIIASPAFVGFLKNCSQAEDMSQLMEYGQTFNEYILVHACDAQDGLNNTITQANNGK